MSLILVSLLLIIIWLLYRKYLRKFYYLRSVPTFPSNLILGHANVAVNSWGKLHLNFEQRMVQGMISLAKVYDKEGLCKFYLGWEPWLMVYKPETVEVVLSSTTVINKADSYKYLHPWLGEGLLTSTGDKWRYRRKMLTPAFHFRILDDFIPIMHEQSSILVKVLSTKLASNCSCKGQVIPDIVPYITRCTLDIICETAMGVKIRAQDNPDSEYVNAIYWLGESFLYRNLHINAWFDYSFYKSHFGIQYVKSLQFLHQFTRSVIQNRKREIQIAMNERIMSKNSGKNREEDLIGRKKRLAFLDLLLEQHLYDGAAMTEEDIREEVDTFMFEGHDTTAMGISWGLYMLGLYQDIQTRVHEELDDIFEDDRERQITMDDLKRMKYLECCIKESLRLFPSVPVIGRIFPTDTTICGHSIPRGTIAGIFIYQLHRNEELFPNAEVYDPDRFLSEKLLKRHPYAYVPFSAGIRNCIGQRFALQEEKIVLANILRNFKIKSLDYRDKVDIAFELVIRPKTPIRMEFIKR